MPQMSPMLFMITMMSIIQMNSMNFFSSMNMK